MTTAEYRLPAALDERYDRVVAALTRRLAETARTTRRETIQPCCHDFLVPLLHPDFLEAAATRPQPPAQVF